jgi:trk system potassium uptake protein TrkH
MNLRLTFYVQGVLLLFLAALLLTPIPFSLYYQDQDTWVFLASAALTALVGGALVRYCHSREPISHREGFAIVTFAWIGYAMFGGLPFVFSGTLTNPLDAFFEAMSGFTTVGASVLTDIESVSRSVLFWRALTQWVGGMGFIVLGLAILPLLGVGGMQLYRAEAPGPTADRLTPRIQDTARLLWGVYVLLTVAGVLLLWLGDMDFYDALCHTFSAIATGGFSTRNTSMSGFSTYCQVVVIGLMFLGATNFTLHYHALRGQLGKYGDNEEWRFYLSVLVVTTLVIFLFQYRQADDQLINLRDSAFTVTSVVTTTGYATTDYERWPVGAQGLLFMLMFIGGCAGSTCGGIKFVRALLLLKHASLQMLRLIHPRRVKILKLDRHPVPLTITHDILGFVVLYLGIFTIASLLLTAVGVDLVTAGSGVIACLTTVGPGLGGVGPTDNYAGLPAFAKVVLSLCMLLGRLEVSTTLVLLYPSFWRK